MTSHFENWTATFSGLARVRACGGGGSGIYGQTTPYQGGGGGGGAFAELIDTVTLGHTYTILVPDKTPAATVADGSQAEFDFGTTSPLHCVGASGKAPGFFAPVGKGGLVADCIGTTKVAGHDGEDHDFSAGPGRTGGASGDPSGHGTGGVGSSDGTAPGGGGGGGSSAGGGGGGPNNNEGRGAAGYVSVQQILFPHTLVVFGTPPPRPTGRSRKYGYIMTA